MAFFSGAEQAWITDALHREGRDEERRNVLATASVIRGVTIVLGGFLGSLIALFQMRYIWLPMVITAPIAYFVVHRFMNGNGEPIKRISESEALRASVDLLRRSRALVWVIVAMIVFGGVVSFNHFWSPYFKPLVGTVGLSIVWAIVYGGFSLSGLVVRRLTIKQGDESMWIIGSLILTGIGLAMAGFVSGLILLISSVIIHEFGRGMFTPLVDSFVQHRVESGYRATFGSLQALLGRLGLAVTPFVIWLTIRNNPNTTDTIGYVWMACGIFIVTGASVLFLFRPK